MKKTVSVNIKGINFLIEEDAYELLQDYMDRLTVALKNDSGSKEIIEDVELRIAEICSSKLSETKTVIELEDIEGILAALGNPEEFVDEEENDGAEKSETVFTESTNGKNDRRLFRDSEAATLGGVCAGIANYFGVDVVVMRAIFIVFLIFGGFGIPLYIVLWIIIPKAESTIDKLRMKGRPITVESVKQEVEDAAERVKSGSKSFSNKLRNDDGYKKRISRGKRIVTSLFGIWFMGMGLIFSIMFTVFIVSGFQFLPFDGASGYMSITDFGELVLSNPSDIKYAWIGGLMLCLSSIFFCFLMGTVLLFRVKNKWTKWTLGGLFLTGITGLIIAATLGVRTARDFTFDGKWKSPIGVSSEDKLVVIPRLRGFENNESFSVTRHDNMMNIELKDGRIYTYGIEIKYMPSNDTSFHIYKVLSARGASNNIADRKSKSIRHGAEIINDTLFVDVKYSFPEKDKLRDQDVTIIIEIPKGKKVRWKDREVMYNSGQLKSNDSSNEYYEEYGRIRSDGTYEHHYDRDYYHYHGHHYHSHKDDFGSELEHEIKQEIIEEFQEN